VPGSHARVEHLVERLDGAAVRHDVTGDDEVVDVQTPAHHLPRSAHVSATSVTRTP
jgi:hypothetical protein